MSNTNISFRSSIPLLNLLLAMLLGIFLRFIPLQNVAGVNYKFFLHAHSHVAFLGWVYMSLVILVLKTFFNLSPFQSKEFTIQFWLSQLSVIGMLIFFPIQGYALFSITFSTIHILISWWFSFSIVRDSKDRQLNEKFPVAIKFLKASLFFLVVSSIGPFALGVIMAKGLAAHPLYNLSIYYYLHFQYNGWFTFAVIALVIALFESRGLVKNRKALNTFFWLMFFSCIPAYFLSTLYLNPSEWIYFIGFVAAGLQLIAFYYLIKSVRFLDFIKDKDKTIKVLINIAFVCYFIKVILQFFSVFLPIFEIRNFIIGYLHLTLIGFVSFTLLVFYFHFKWLVLNKLVRISIIMVTGGFIFSEMIIFTQGVLSWIGIIFPYYYSMLFISSMFMPLGIGILLVNCSRRI